MLTTYIQAAMHHATYEILPDDEQPPFYGAIPDCPGVWASADTLEACRDALQSVLEGWIALGLRMGHTLPIIDAIDINPSLVAEAA